MEPKIHWLLIPIPSHYAGYMSIMGQSWKEDGGAWVFATKTMQSGMLCMRIYDWRQMTMMTKW